MHLVTSNMELLCCFVARMSGTCPSTDKLHHFIYNQNRRAQEEEKDEIGEEKRFGLEDGLQGREVDDKHLTEQGSTHCEQKHVVGQEPYGNHRLGL